MLEQVVEEGGDGLRGVIVIIGEPGVGNAGVGEEKIVGFMCHLQVRKICLEQVADLYSACRLEA